MLATAGVMLATAGCNSGDDTVLVSPGDGFVRLLAADSDSFYFTKRDDAGGVLYRGNPNGAPHTVLAEGVGGWLSGEGLVHDGYLYYSDGDGGLSRIRTTGGDLEPLVPNLAGISGLAAAGQSVYILHAGGLGVFDIESGELTSLNAAGGWFSLGLAAVDGQVVWSSGASLVARELALPGDPAVVLDRETDCPEEEACSFHRLDIVGVVDAEVLYVDNTLTRYDTGEHWSNGDPRWDARAEGGALHALTFGPDGAVSSRLVEDDIVLAAARDGALWGVRLGGEVVALEPVRELARTIEIEDELLTNGEFHPRLLATATHLIFPATDGSIHGIALP